jgi:myo-inositol-1(or 4)-monophosphatase
VGEEFGSRESGGAFRWVIDPIDGTRSYIIGSPLWGTLIGVLQNGDPYFGLMDQPFTGERFWSEASASRCRTRNGKASRVHTRLCENLRQAVVTSTHPDLFESDIQRQTLAALGRQVRMTRFGGDCYGYCLLAAGFVDVVIECGLKPYDIVALIPIIERAGGRVTTWDGKSPAEGGDIVASGDPRLHEAVLRAIAKV